MTAKVCIDIIMCALVLHNVQVTESFISHSFMHSGYIELVHDTCYHLATHLHHTCKVHLYEGTFDAS